MSTVKTRRVPDGQTSEIYMPFDVSKLNDLGLRIEVRDDRAGLWVKTGRMLMLHEDFARHVKTELGQRAVEELTEGLLEKYASAALRRAFD